VVEVASDPSVDSSGQRVAVLYHRPVGEPFHGGSVHIRGFVERLSRSLRVQIVAPPRDSRISRRSSRLSPQLKGFTYLVLTLLEQARFVASQAHRRSNRRADVLLSFDVYVAPITAVWARITRTPFVYYPQDSNREVVQSWTESRIRGAALFRTFRTAAEALALSAAQIVVAVSESTKLALEAEGVPETKLKVCTVKRAPPVRQNSSVETWRTRVNGEGKILATFVGSFQYAPNVRAFEFLKRVVSPAVRSNPRLQIIVAGLDSEPYVSQSLENLTVVGTVPDLDGLLFASQIGLAPMDVAGGTSGKIVDYVLHGLRVVATRDASAGVRTSPAIFSTTLDGFVRTLLTVASEVQSSSGSDNRVNDPMFVKTYTEYDDVDDLVKAIRSLRRTD
jgi:hypothetical protein